MNLSFARSAKDALGGPDSHAVGSADKQRSVNIVIIVVATVDTNDDINAGRYDYNHCRGHQSFARSVNVTLGGLDSHASAHQNKQNY